VAQPVQAQPVDAQTVVVTHGLAPDQRVVVQGASLIAQVR
jgi:cobalt-zinc-cadmium efflux system membrane fusion protein